LDTLCEGVETALISDYSLSVVLAVVGRLSVSTLAKSILYHIIPLLTSPWGGIFMNTFVGPNPLKGERVLS